MAYLYGSEGTWRAVPPGGLEHRFEYYEHFASSGYPADAAALIAYADGSRLTTARDANGYLLRAPGGYAFHEHNGRGVGGGVREKPFTQFWFDDNWLARIMAQAYARPEPSGLYEPEGPVRWKILRGDASSGPPSGGEAFDLLALDGLFLLSARDFAGALEKWQALLAKSEYFYDEENQRYAYPAVSESYHLGLWKILTENLIEFGEALPEETEAALLQHALSLRSQILSLQENAGSEKYGWRTGIHDPGTLINTESTAVNALALGANALEVFEADSPPLRQGKGFFARPHHVLSAVKDLSPRGLMLYGPGWERPPGQYRIDFLLRSSAPQGRIARLEAYDPAERKVLATKTLSARHLKQDNRWSRVTLAVSLRSRKGLEFRVHWLGGSNLDVACVRVRGVPSTRH